MFFDLSKLWNKSINYLELDEKIEIDDIDNFGERIAFNKPVEFKGTFSKRDGYIELKGTVKCDLNLTCSMCLESFNESYELEVDEAFSKAESDKYFSIPENGEIDLSEIVEGNVVAYLPIQKRCSENCKGLCSQCGINLNLSQCGCKPIFDEEDEEDEIDPRLAKLQNFFNKN